MIPWRVTPPAGPVVSLDALRRRCRIGPNSAEFDSQLQELEAAAVAHLDGWRGVLGRCILEQQWAVRVDRAGCIRLPFPDVSAVAVDAGTASLLPADCLGSRVHVSGPCTLTMTAALAEDALPAVGAAVSLWVQKRFDGLTGPEGESFDRAIRDLIAPLRWTRL